jgi:holo-[acyl-carrier protein] synthase
VILGIGVDVVAIERISRSLAEGEGRFEKQVFTPEERAACADRADRAQALAARFAAKEACFKALGAGLGQGVSFQQVEVVDGEGGRPELRLSGSAAERARALGVGRVHVTLSHELAVAAAVVVLEA